jgi:1,4-dihydroxy-2-naphthoyl-CoA synthase
MAGLESQMVLESETIASAALTAEGEEGIGAFLQKRKPDFPAMRAARSNHGREADET